MEVIMSDKYENLKVVDKNYSAPVRKDIRRELMKVSNFTLKEISIMGWSSLYKAHSLIVKYGQTDVEEDFRSKDWFNEAVAEITDEKIKDFDIETGFKMSEAEIAKQEKEEEIKDKVKDLKKEFKKSEFKLSDFTDLLNEMINNSNDFSVRCKDDYFVDILKKDDVYASFMLYKNSLYMKQ
jgi:hypothetical protein